LFFSSGVLIPTLPKLTHLVGSIFAIVFTKDLTSVAMMLVAIMPAMSRCSQSFIVILFQLSLFAASSVLT